MEVIGGSWDQRVCGRQFFYTEIAIIFAFVLDIICPKNSILKRSLTLVYFPMARLETPPIIKLRKSWSTIYFTDLLSRNIRTRWWVELLKLWLQNWHYPTWALLNVVLPTFSITPFCRKSASTCQSQNFPVSCLSQPVADWLGEAA